MNTAALLELKQVSKDALSLKVSIGTCLDSDNIGYIV
jgi:hypothetical protein